MGLPIVLRGWKVTKAQHLGSPRGTGFNGIAQPKDYNTYGRQILLGMNYKFH
jgi:hypothetical protein